jgi:putative mRNA 3-end processing factor
MLDRRGKPRPMNQQLLTVNENGLYCPAGDFYIDPWRRVPRAVITHAHSDHARFGSQRYLAAAESRELLEIRLGKQISLQTLDYGEPLRTREAQITLYPAGHIRGSAQVRIEVAGEVAVVTGDYKLQADPTCAPWEPVRCHLLVTESTFGLPVFRWPSTDEVLRQILAWYLHNRQSGRPSVLLAYSLGKAQRLMAEILRHSPEGWAGRLYVHGSIIRPTQAYLAGGVSLPEPCGVSQAPADIDWSQCLILAPPSAQHSTWMKRFGDPSVAMASGWMAIRGTRRRRHLDQGFVVSDHVDWPDLLQAIELCQAEEVWVTHGFSDIVARYCQEHGRPASVMATPYGGEAADEESTDEEPVDPESQVASEAGQGLPPDLSASEGFFR